MMTVTDGGVCDYDMTDGGVCDYDMTDGGGGGCDDDSDR